MGDYLNTVWVQVYSKQFEEMMSDLQQQHAKCAGSLRRQAANAEPYVQVGLAAAAAAVPSQHHMMTFHTADKCTVHASDLLQQSE